MGEDTQRMHETTHATAEMLAVTSPQAPNSNAFSLSEWRALQVKQAPAQERACAGSYGRSVVAIDLAKSGRTEVLAS